MLSIKETLGVIGVLEIFTFISLAYFASRLQSLQSQKEILIASRDSLNRALLVINENRHPAHSSLIVSKAQVANSSRFADNRIKDVSASEFSFLQDNKLGSQISTELKSETSNVKVGVMVHNSNLNSPFSSPEGSRSSYDLKKEESKIKDEVQRSSQQLAFDPPARRKVVLDSPRIASANNAGTAKWFEVVWNDWGNIHRRRFKSRADAEAFYSTIDADLAHRLLEDGEELRRHVYADAPWNPAWVPPPDADEENTAAQPSPARTGGGHAGVDEDRHRAERAGDAGEGRGDPDSGTSNGGAARTGVWGDIQRNQAQRPARQSESDGDGRRRPSDSDSRDADVPAAAAERGARTARQGQERLRQAAGERGAGPRPVRRPAGAHRPPRP
jgi:hypothetical protein